MPLADFGVVQAQLLIMENVDIQLQRQGFNLSQCAQWLGFVVNLVAQAGLQA